MLPRSPCKMLGRAPPCSTVCEHFVNLPSLRDECVFHSYLFTPGELEYKKGPMVPRWIIPSELWVHPTRFSGSDWQEDCAGSLVTLKNQFSSRTIFFCFPFQFPRALKLACPPRAELGFQQCMAKFPKSISAKYLNLCHHVSAVLGFVLTGPNWSFPLPPFYSCVKNPDSLANDSLPEYMSKARGLDNAVPNTQWPLGRPGECPLPGGEAEFVYEFRKDSNSQWGDQCSCSHPEEIQALHLCQLLWMGHTAAAASGPACSNTEIVQLHLQFPPFPHRDCTVPFSASSFSPGAPLPFPQPHPPLFACICLQRNHQGRETFLPSIVLTPFLLPSSSEIN